ncbi:restriction endonuclease subunit S [Bradymonas sediminis]|uniref:Restriction endonuclease subunit S n=1 Tax=Bradymonas sediminis TaxID=1548548 RepID=A0A2Z4FJ40_9DELT|nr:restriction endonuclease subunit S [Bradymonas sediminis]AWV88698.1 restriction endonuclease subunit S [Bradymonas sediminis]TDP63614.1 type I restriction enzyme S subunit [Bradymonas sediminis]
MSAKNIYTVGDVCKITSSKRIYRADYVASGVPFFRSKEIIEQYHGNQVSSELYISEAKFEAIRNKFGVPLPGDLLLTSVGTLGVPYLVKSGDRFYFKDGNLTWFRCKENLQPKYLYYWFVSPQGKAQQNRARIGSSQAAYTISLLKKMEIYLPPIPVQRRIADILSAYDDLIENNNRRMALLEESIHLLYREWFVYLRFPGHERVKVVDGVPEGWSRQTLGELVTLNYGKSLTKKTRIPGNVPVYGSSGIIGSHNKSLVGAQSVIVGRKGNVGAVYWSETPFFPIDTVFYISPEESSLFVFAMLKAQTFVNSDVAVPGLNRNYAYSKKILVPSESLLHEFNKIARIIWVQRESLHSQNQKLREARDLLLPRLMDGRIPV